MLKEILESAKELVSQGDRTNKEIAQLAFSPEDLSDVDFHQLKVAGTELYSSFQPRKTEARFLPMRMSTTPGVKLAADLTPGVCSGRSYDRVRNFVYVVRDPVRPFEVQVGELRS
jgi:hypothetical protein